MTTPAQALPDFEDLLLQAERAHGHLCAGQILGVRMALLALRRLNISDPRPRHLPDGTLNPDRKRLVTFVEIDRCATDAIAVVTACRLGKRALKFRDWGKMAATFVDLNTPVTPSSSTYKGIRISALESSKARARELYPDIEDKNQQQMRAYRELPDSDLFSEQWVAVPIHPRELPGYKSPRIACALCGEGINYDRETILGNQTLCQSCAHPESRYYQPL
jgi:formylmethanofuran dehydrogenase subunit E